MATDATAYFEQQLAPVLVGEPIVARGYFRSFVGEPGFYGFSDVAALAEMADLFAAASRAKGFFVALTPTRILAVVTRAPATRAPLLENLGVLALPTDGLRVRIDHERLQIDGGDAGRLILATTLSNPHVPQHGRLVEELSRSFGDGTTIATLRRARTYAHLRWIALVVAALVVGLLAAWAL